MGQDPATLDVTKKLDAEPGALVSALDETREYRP